jgi:integrase
MVKEAGVPHLTPHGLRHAYATAALEAGVDPKVVSQHLGHASVSTTYDIYSHVMPDLEKEAALRIEAKLLGK